MVVSSVSACVTVLGDEAEATIWLMFLPRPPLRYAQTEVIGATTILSCDPSPDPPLAAKTPMTRKLWRLILMVWPTGSVVPKRLVTTVEPSRTTRGWEMTLAPRDWI